MVCAALYCIRIVVRSNECSLFPVFYSFCPVLIKCGLVYYLSVEKELERITRANMVVALKLNVGKRLFIAVLNFSSFYTSQRYLQ